MKDAKEKNAEEKITCEHCGKKIEKNKIIKVNLKKSKILNICQNCIDEIYDNLHFKEVAKYNLGDTIFTGYQISNERFNKIKDMKNEAEKEKELELKKKFKTPADIKKKT